MMITWGYYICEDQEVTVVHSSSKLAGWLPPLWSFSARVIGRRASCSSEHLAPDVAQFQWTRTGGEHTSLELANEWMNCSCSTTSAKKSDCRQLVQLQVEMVNAWSTATANQSWGCCFMNETPGLEKPLRQMDVFSCPAWELSTIWVVILGVWNLGSVISINPGASMGHDHFKPVGADWSWSLWNAAKRQGQAIGQPLNKVQTQVAGLQDSKVSWYLGKNHPGSMSICFKWIKG